MKKTSLRLVAFTVAGVLLLVSSVRIAAMSQTSENLKAPRDFSYEISVATLHYTRPFIVRSFSGRIEGPAENGLPRVLVERMAANWKERIDAVFTDAQGRFRFPGQARGTCYIRVSLPGYAPAIFIMKASSSARSDPHLALDFAN